MTTTTTTDAEMERVVRQISNFVIEKKVGRGAFGVIFSAYDKHRKTKVAIKVERRPNIRQLIDHEFRILKKLHTTYSDLQGFPRVYDRYVINRTDTIADKIIKEMKITNSYHAMCLDLLGENLHQL